MYHLIWHVATDGYEWLDRNPRGQGVDPFLSPVDYQRKFVQFLAETGQDVDQPDTWDLSNPFPMDMDEIRPLEQHSGLFLTLAHLPCRHEDIEVFASTYGLLSYPTEKGSYQYWVEQILWLKWAATLWELIKAKDQAGLASYVQWIDAVSFKISTYSPDVPCAKDPPPWGLKKPFDSGHIHYGRDGQEPVLHTWQEFNTNFATPVSTEDLVRPSWYYLESLLSSFLSQGLSTRVFHGPDDDHPFICHEPVSLLSALWLQFALAVSDDKTYQQCPTCKNYFELAPGLNRADRLFCTDACRTRAYRQRIARAKELFADGSSVEAIAQELGTNPETVAAWIVRRRDDASQGVKRARKRGRQPAEARG